MVIFTHDLAFLLYLQEAVQKQEATHKTKIPLAEWSIERNGDAPGYCFQGLPFGGLKVSARIGVLKDKLQKARAVWNKGLRSDYHPLVGEIYDLLRASWERAVEEVLFNGVVERFSRGVQTQKLSEVTILASDVAAVDAGMTKASAKTPAHDEAAALMEPVTEPDEVEADIQALEGWVAEVRRRISEARKARKAS